jgi:ABC-type polysaccharide/polyol phosphate export permease
VPWFYLTPIVYPKQLLGKLQLLIDLNPLTGVVTLFRLASVGAADWVRPVAVTAVVTVVLVVVGAEVQRRHDRLFVDLL